LEFFGKLRRKQEMNERINENQKGGKPEKNEKESLDVNREVFSGKDFELRLIQFILDHHDEFDLLKTTSCSNDYVSTHVIRCNALTQLINELSNKGKVAQLSIQHDFLKLFLSNFLLEIPFEAVDHEVPKQIKGDLGESKLKKVDFIPQSNNIPYEVKTASGITSSKIDGLLSPHLNQMIKEKDFRHQWWFVFVNQVRMCKDTYNRDCLYYIVVMEINAKRLDLRKKDKKKVLKKAQECVDEAIEKVHEEDDLDEGFLLPVNNIWAMDNLRNQVRQKDVIIQQKDEVIQQKDEVIQQKDEVIQQKDEVIQQKEAEFQQKLQEKDKLLEELQNKLKKHQ
jgi:hypothetical protein